LGTDLGKTAPENPPVPWNSEDSTDTDLAEESFRFMIWNDLSGEEEEEESSFIEDEVREGSISATDLSAEFDDFDDIITDDSDDEEYLPRASDNRVRFSLSAQEAKFSLQARPRTFRRRL
jgi:hypothetical protein